MRVRLHGYFARYELSSWPEAGAGSDGSRRLQITELDEARQLLRRLLSHDASQSLRPLLLEVGHVGPVDDHEQLLELLARLIARGQIVVERHPIEIMASETVELHDTVSEYEPETFTNEFEDEIRVVHWLTTQPAPVLVLDSVPEPPPVIVLDSVPEPPPVLVLDSVPEPPPIIVLGSEPEPGPMLVYGGDRSEG